MKFKDIQALLVEIGWPIAVDGHIGPITKQAIYDFQQGYTFIELRTDGIAGPNTHAALLDCARNADGRPSGMCAEFFSFREFASKGNGWIRVHPRLLNRLDAYRRLVGPVRIISGYRDFEHNKRVGGAGNSQHVYGTAVDIQGKMTSGQMKELGFSGIGIAPGGMVVHVDVRAEGPNNTTGASVGNPTMWHY